MNKDSELFKMVETEIKRRYESAEEEEIKEILGKKPVSRLLKDEEIRPFDEIKRELETKIEQQNFIRKKWIYGDAGKTKSVSESTGSRSS